MKNLYILVGPNFYEIDLFLNDLKSEIENPDIYYLRTYKSMTKTDISDTLSKVASVLESNSDSVFGDSFFFDDEDKKNSLTIFETSDASSILYCLENKHLLSDSNILVLICSNKPSDKAYKAIKDIDDDNTEVIYVEHISNEIAFKNFCNEILDTLGFDFEDDEDKEFLLESLEHECSFSLDSNWNLETIELNSNFRNIVYDKGYAFNMIESINSYSSSPSLDDLKDFFSTKSRNNKRQILIKLLSQKDSFGATDILMNELSSLEITEVKSFLGYFCFCLEEYVKYMKKEDHKRTPASIFMNKKNFKIYYHIRLLEKLSELRQNFYISKESILTSISLELHKASH